MSYRHLVAAVLAASFFPACAGSAAAAQVPKKTASNVPMVQDWSTSLSGFRNPMTPEQAKARGSEMYKRWQRLAADPRFMLSLQSKLEAQAATENQRALRRPAPPSPPASGAPSGIARDWKVALGGNATGVGFGDGEGTAGMYPAKFNFNINATPSCASDFIVYPTSSPGATSVGAQTSRTSQAIPDNDNSAGTVTLSLAGRQTVLSGAPGNPNSGLTFTTTLSGATNANNLRDAINRWTGTTNMVATSAAGVVTVKVRNSRSLVTVAETFGGWAWNANPAFPAGDVAGMPSILAYNQLYNTSCDPASASPAAGAARVHPLYPNVYWSYNTGGTVTTSPVLSYWDNGQQVAFIQSNGAQAELVLLKWNSGEGTNGQPFTPTAAVSAADYRDPVNNAGGCTGASSCMLRISFSGTTNDTISSPFVDYFNDVLYVGAANGSLHKFTGVFGGTPAEVTSGGFPATVSTVALGSPVYDFNGSVFVGSSGSATVGVGGALHKVNASTGAVSSSAKLAANAANTGVRAAPMLDIAAGKVYAFVYQGAGATTATCTSAPCREVWQFDTASFPGTPVRATLGAGNATARIQWAGAFDSAWYNSADSTGSIYVCGADPADLNDAVLWKLTLTAGAMNATALQGPQLSSNSAQQGCSPVTRVRNGANEYLYVAPTDLGVDGNQGLCTGNCMYMIDVADLRSYEEWTFDVSGNINTTVGALSIGGASFVPIASGASTCTAAGGGFDVNGNPASDLASLVACVQQVPGYTVSSVNGTSFTVRSNALANVSDSLVTEVADIVNFSQTRHRDGSALGTSWQPNSLPAAGLPLPSIGGTTGIIIDNLGANPGNSQIYFMTIPSPGVSVQASQSGLQ